MSLAWILRAYTIWGKCAWSISAFNLVTHFQCATVQRSLISTCFSFHILDFVCSCSDSVIYTVPTRQIQIIFSILLFAGFIPKSTQDNCSCISNKACALCSTLIWDVLFQWRLAEVKRETVSRMEKAGPFDCCCSRQSVASPSLCLCQGSRWTLWAHFVVFSRFSVLSWCWEFWNLWFYCLTVLFIAEM